MTQGTRNRGVEPFSARDVRLLWNAVSSGRARRRDAGATAKEVFV